MFHQSFYPPSQFHNHRQFYKPTHSSFYPSTSRTNRSSQHLNFSRDFERFPMPPHGFNSIPKGPHPFWRPNLGRFQRQYPRTSVFHFQDHSTFYYMSDPIVTHDNRITIQLTKVHIGLNGDQQRVFVEQEFSNENELKKFVKNLRSNFEKTFNNHEENQSNKSGVIVIEEPDEEPRIYEQTTHEQERCLPLLSSCSTIRSNKRRRNQMKYQRQNRKSSPKFEKENHFPFPPNPHPHWKSNGFQPPPRATRMKGQEKPPLYRRPQQPRTIDENLLFTNNRQQQTRVDRSKSDCQNKTAFRNRNRLPQYFDHRQRYSTPMVFPSTPPFFRNTQVQLRLFNFYQPNSNHF